MRFRASFSERGPQILEKIFLAALEKSGKTVQLLLGPEDINFVQTGINTDGMHATARFAVDVLFEPQTYKIQSKHFDLIAFQVDIGLLLRVLRGASNNGATSIEVRLTQKAAPGSPDTSPKPFLSFAGRGPNVSLIQDLPITKPFAAHEIDRLVAAKELPQLCPFYVDMGPCAAMLGPMVDRMKGIGDTLELATCRNGDLHLCVRTLTMKLGTHVRDLDVLPPGSALPELVDRSRPADQQLQAALDVQGGSLVYVQLKQLGRVLSMVQMAMPAQVLIGSSEDQGQVHVMFVFKDPGRADAAYDENVGLSFRLPLKDDP